MENDKTVINEIENISDTIFEHFSFVVDKGQSPLRIDKFLMARIENATRNKIQQAAKAGYIFVGEEPVKSNYKVKKGDKIKVLFDHPPYQNLLKPEPIGLEIIYEDDALIVLNKPPGIVVHPGHGNYSGTLLNGLLYHFNRLPKNQNGRPGIVHRIDKDTSGLLVIAKTEFAMTNLAKQFFDKTTERIYNALIWGDIKEDKGTFIGAIGRHPKNRLQMSVYEDNSKGKEAITHFKVLERFRYVTLVECQLETGRTHQIRAHMKHFGHTLFNDSRYGGDSILKGTSFSKYRHFIVNCFKILPRQALQAKTLGFKHPVTGDDLIFDSQLPKDFIGVLKKWRSYIASKGI